MTQKTYKSIDTLEQLNDILLSDKIEQGSFSSKTARNSQEIDMPYEYETLKKEETMMGRLKSKLPPLALVRMIIKASLAVLIGSLFVFEPNCRSVVGSASIFVPIGTILYSPVRPIGVQIETTVIGLVCSLASAGWTCFVMYIANLVRDPSNPSPIQPKSSGVLAVFMLLAVFGLTYVRIKVPKAMFGCIFASIIVAFALTQASVTPGFQPVIVAMFLKPVAISAAICLAINMFIWPEDSITKYLGILDKSLSECDKFFNEYTVAFLSENTTGAILTLPTLHTSLQTSILKLIDCKQEVQREILYHPLSQSDVSELTRLVKAMHTPLQGIGLGLITKLERVKENSTENLYTMVSGEPKAQKQEFIQGLLEIRETSQSLAMICNKTIHACQESMLRFADPPRTFKTTFLWPFPRLSTFFKKSKSRSARTPLITEYFLHQLDQIIAKYEKDIRRASCIFVASGSSNQFEYRFTSFLQIIYHFRFYLREYAVHLRELAVFVIDLEAKYNKRKLYLPHLSLRKRFRSSHANQGVSLDSKIPSQDTSGTFVADHDMGLAQITTRTDVVEDRDIQLVQSKDRHGRSYARDPDVNPPETAVERMFLGIYHFLSWFGSVDAVFALKTAVGFVLLSLPAFLPQSAGWFFDLRGQWVTFTLMLWMAPISGMFYFTVILRVTGTILGGILGIVVWEVTRGNPIGLTIFNFVVMLPLNYIFFTNQIFAVVAIMTQVTNILVVCYEYEFVLSGATSYDSAELLAGKRILLVLIGVVACAILSMIPRPVTGRVELRKRISKTIRDLSKIYGILAVDILTYFDHPDEPTEGQRKAFRKLAMGIQRQIADERTYVRISRLEPPLRGKFPVEVYTQLVEKVDNMAGLIQSMAFASRSIDKAWKKNLVSVMKEERMQYLASTLSIMKILSSTLASKMALPPFMFSADDLKNRITQKLGEAILTSSEHLDNDSFPGYCAYAIASQKFSLELEETIECIEKLVGVEDPEQWLLLNA